MSNENNPQNQEENASRQTYFGPKDVGRSDSIYNETTADDAIQRGFQYRTFSCPVCHSQISIVREQMGKPIKCPDCDAKFNAPTNLDFDSPNEYEKRYYNDEQKKRDELYSPIRNPTRKGIDLQDAGIYGIGDEWTRERATRRADAQEVIVVVCKKCKSANFFPKAERGKTLRCPHCGDPILVVESKPAAERRGSEYRSFDCPICGTKLSIRKEQMGTEMVCPDCHVKIKAPQNLMFDDRTELEKQRVEEEKKERDELLSPIRNPDRKGIKVDPNLVYGIDSNYAPDQRREGASEAPKTIDFIPFRCRICETFFQVPSVMLGQKLICPDCGAANVVTDALAQQKKTIDVKFQPRERGVYESKESTNAGTEADETYRAENELNPNAETGALQNAFRRAQSIKAEEERTKGREARQAASEVAPKRKKSKKKNKGFWARLAERRRLELDADPDELAPRQLILAKDGSYQWNSPSPPTPLVLLNKTFCPLKGVEIYARIFTSGLIMAMLAVLVSLTLYCSYRAYEEGSFLFGTLTAFFGLTLAFANFIGCSQLALNFWSVYNAGHTGAKLVAEWRTEDEPFTFMFYGVATFAIAILCAILGMQATPPLENALGLDVSRLGGNVEFVAPLWRGAIGIWLLYPVARISITMTQNPLGLLSLGVLKSMIMRVHVWLGYYALSAILFLTPVALVGYGVIRAGAPSLLATTIVASLAAFVVAFFAAVNALLLGRLSWIVEDYLRRKERD